MDKSVMPVDMLVDESQDLYFKTVPFYSLQIATMEEGEAATLYYGEDNLDEVIQIVWTNYLVAFKVVIN